METITTDSVTFFLDRFCGLDDGVLRRIDFSWDGKGMKHAVVCVSVMDKAEEYKWKNLVLAFRNVVEIVFREGNATCQVLSNGMQVAWFGKTVCAALSPFTCDSVTFEEFQASDFYILCETISWRVQEYSEN